METIYAARREKAIRMWTERLLAFFPEPHPGLCPPADNPFATPVGQAIRNAAGILCDAAAGQPASQDDVRAALSALIRLCAVQARAPSQAAGLLFELKPIFRELFAAQMESKKGIRALLEAESRVDTLAMIAFDLFVRDREAIFETRCRELRRRSVMLERLAFAHAAGGSASLDSAAQEGARP